MENKTLCLLEAIAALERGEEVEYTTSTLGKWMLLIPDHWTYANLKLVEYRLKPKPMEIWVNFYSNKPPCVHSTKKAALYLAGDDTTREAVHFIEVVGEE